MSIEEAQSTGPSYREGFLHGRKAYILENGVIRVSALRGGGHLGEIRFLSEDPKKSINPMYVPPYQTMEPYEYDEPLHSRQYGSALKAGYMGHMLCFPHFGMPSPEEIENGLGEHGEAAVVEWSLLEEPFADAVRVRLRYGAPLPKTQYKVERTITLRAGSSVVQVQESWENMALFDRAYNYNGHATFGMPFVDLGTNFFDTSGENGMIEVRPSHSLLSGREIRWPEGFLPDGRAVDLRGIQDAPRTHTFYAVALPRWRALNFFSVYNSDYSILAGFLLPGTHHSWVIDWQSNEGDRYVRGIEFGTTPFDEGLSKSVERGTLLGVPTYRWIPGRGRQSAVYSIFLSEIPLGFAGVQDVNWEDGKIVVLEHGTGRKLEIASARP